MTAGIMRGRFAPSPTGYLHLGNVWTAFLCWLQVRQQGGKLILRIEDNDEQRSKELFRQAFLEDLTWLGLLWDEGPDTGGPAGPYTQQERYAVYAAALRQLQERGLLYPCYCTRARLQSIGAPHPGEQYLYDGHCRQMSLAERRQMTRTPSLRIRVPAAEIVFNDGVFGRKNAFLPATCGDFIVRRSDGMYAYQLAVSVDDALMGVTHVLRGADLLASTAQQIWLIRLLGYEAPAYTHVPLLVDSDGHRLSKRQNGITVRYLREQGIDSDTLLSYLAWRGHLLPDRRRYSLTGLKKRCDLQKLTAENIVIHKNLENYLSLFFP